MHDIGILIRDFGLVVVFAAVLAEGLGLPIPSFAFVLIAAGSLYESGRASPAEVILVALVAGLVADVFWYWAGRRFGYRLLGVLCRISISPDSCVQRTESIFTRWGSSTLLIARWVPGLSVVARPLAGAVRQTWRSFLIFDGVGLVIWIGCAVGLGVIFSSAVGDVLDTLGQYGTWGALMVAVALVLYVFYRIAQRQLFIRRLRMDRISVQELDDLMREGKAPMILDVRPQEEQAQRGVIPGAVAVSKDTLHKLPASPDGVVDVVVYCACPNEASAVPIARLLIERGYKRVRPLRGGAEAWTEAGFALVRINAERAS